MLSSRAYLTPDATALRVYKKLHRHGPAAAVNIWTDVLPLEMRVSVGKTRRTPGTLGSPNVSICLVISLHLCRSQLQAPRLLYQTETPASAG